MIYLFRKRNGQIVANTKESAHQMFTSPNNFTTFQPVYLGAVNPQVFKDAIAQVEVDVPISIDKIVKKDGEDVLITLDQYQIDEMILNGDKAMEKRYEALLKKQQLRYNEILEEVAKLADTSVTPADYSKLLAAVEDVRGDISTITSTYKRV